MFVCLIVCAHRLWYYTIEQLTKQVAPAKWMIISQMRPAVTKRHSDIKWNRLTFSAVAISIWPINQLLIVSYNSKRQFLIGTSKKVFHLHGHCERGIHSALRRFYIDVNEDRQSDIYLSCFTYSGLNLLLLVHTWIRCAKLAYWMELLLASRRLPRGRE